ncbi:MAG: serine/threonine-protein kinase [Polyangiaceae bacterium]
MSDPAKPGVPAALQALIKKGQRARVGVAPGDRLGRFEILSEVGKGGHGVVYRAVNVETAEPVAIKVLHEHVASDELNLRMKREAYAMQQLAGTSAAKVFECAATSAGQLYLVMEFLDGRDLGQILDEHEASGHLLPIPTMLEILGPIVQTLHVAHERGIIHRDLKPENITVLRAGGVRLVDFGLMKDLNLAAMTSAGTVAGSPTYIAPEAWAGKPELIDHRVDVYALGVMIFLILTNKRPFEPGNDLFDYITLVRSAPRPSLYALRRDLHPAIDTWTQRALAVNPHERYQTVGELWTALQLLLPRPGYTR